MKSQIKSYGFLIHFHYTLEFLETCFLYARGNGPRGEVLAVLRAPTPQVASGYKNGLVSSLYTYFGLKAALFPIVLLTRDLSADELLENISPLHPYPAPSCRRTELQIVVQGQPRLGQPGRPCLRLPPHSQPACLLGLSPHGEGDPTAQGPRVLRQGPRGPPPPHPCS